MVNQVKTLIGVVIFMSTAVSIAFIRYHRKPQVKTESEYVPEPVVWEYFKSLPNRLAASYYPRKTTHEEVKIEPVFKNKEDGKFNITFLINSKPESAARRKVVRNTWRSIRTFKNVHLYHIFVVGTTENPDIQVNLEEEANKYGDILLVGVAESFINTPKKSLSAYHWIRKNTLTQTKFYITTVDNCVINIATTINFLLQHEKEIMQSIHCGYMFENNTAVIRGKGPRSVSRKLYPKGTYPPFCRQNLVILSLSYIERIHEASLSTNITGFHLEDVLLFGILREKLGIKDSIKNVKNFGKPLVYYPWDETDKVLLKMQLIWKDWKKELYKEVIKSQKSLNPK